MSGPLCSVRHKIFSLYGSWIAAWVCGIPRAGRLAFFNITFDALVHLAPWSCLDWRCDVSFFRQWSAVHVLDPGMTRLFQHYNTINL